MHNNQEELFHFGGEGGGISISKKKTDGGDKYIYYQTECFLDDKEDLQFTNKTVEYNSFEEAFKQINDNDLWYSMDIAVSPAYKSYVLDQIQYSPNMAGKSESEIRAAYRRTKDKFEEEQDFRKLLDEL